MCPWSKPGDRGCRVLKWRSEFVSAVGSTPAPQSDVQPNERPLIWVHGPKAIGMCRNIRTLFNFEPPATEDEIRAASLQFVRKLSGFRNPSKVNETVFYAAVDDIASASGRLLDSLESSATPKNRQEEAVKKARAAQKFRQ
jgi:hypothetical protein